MELTLKSQDQEKHHRISSSGVKETAIRNALAIIHNCFYALIIALLILLWDFYGVFNRLDRSTVSEFNLLKQKSVGAIDHERLATDHQ